LDQITLYNPSHELFVCFFNDDDNTFEHLCLNNVISSVIGVVESDVSTANVIDMFKKLTMKELC